MRESIKIFLKVSIAGAILYFLHRSGKLDFSIIADSLTQHYNRWTIALILLIIVIFVSAFRWRMLLHIRAVKRFKMVTVAKLTWIGLLFNTVLPGAVSGDFIKVLYAKDHDKNFTKTFLLTSILIDRVIGLLGLLGVLGLSSLINYTDLVNKSETLKNLVHFNFLIFLGMMTFVVSLFLPLGIQDYLLRAAQKIPLLGNLTHRTLKVIWEIGKEKKIIFKAIAMSFCIHIVNIIAFWTMASPYFNEPISLNYAFSFIPLGLVTIAIPITPQGLGVGNLAFDKLFSWFGVTNGSSLFNFYFLALLSVNILGIFPYIFSGKRHTLKEAESL